MTRFFDILFSGIAIIILLPFMIPIMIALKLTGEHDVFYSQIRIGKGRKEFKLLKFATMLRDSPNLAGGLYTSKNDPRMLPMGKFLRKTKINELPQLLNIFAGQMSIIGYRPTVREHFEGYPENCKVVLEKSRPGLSGIGSIVFRNEEEILQNFEDKKSFHQNSIAPYKAALEVWYIQHKTLWLYLKLIFMTAEAVLNPSSKKWRTAFKDLPPVPSELEQYI
ncbi:sugar transferase [Treponema brennaborense]|uniref:Sugar transferase n=1 Tax=Treponema brennaborense (strain DSM 12168 / CIP 105900 / DD5/3) TaxID=906968 RepID=F4LPQ9_TREBD|nr:sugar transferase [Treponema brennaborense]AEE17055.1 sugar transferase [Treponema brennaborense DSM 12168]